MLSFTSSPDGSQNIQTMRLRDDPPPITQPQRPAKKRKTPPTIVADQQQPPAQQQQQQQQQLQHVLPPPPHPLMHPIPGPIPPGFPYAPADYTPGGMPAGPHQGLPIQQQQQPAQSQSPPPNGSQRALSSTKRAEQNRKAQRAFRERRDQHVKALESRSQLLDAALASADEANRRWEECRALVDQLRVENAALRAALSQAHLLPPGLSNSTASANHNGAQQDQPKPSEPSTETNQEASEKPSDQNTS
ncbi:hypothetical protein GALMADRAFT_249497 [Galerina marginata CBS 339.88]|uniref:BZIP domain-containing protein n=1 Tax=Galerina marginata (strain CBS 339.88) TaxID=685588 RepID=A0A067T908_GALM3|nr:hypothetical protein GALMADRAFT_249497 [Galerina marginata CBS 339.88]